MTDLTVSDAPSEAISRLLSDYGGTWPPRPSFSGWPNSWNLFADICDEMPQRLCQNKDPEQFRAWMRERLHKIDLTEVLVHVEGRLTKQDPLLLGFLACLAYLKNGYRWGAVPILPQERQRTTLQFPEHLSAPLDKIANLHGISSYVNFFVLVYANMIYDESGPTKIRFYFNHPPELKQFEESFFTTVSTMESLFTPILKAAGEYCRLTSDAMGSSQNAARLQQTSIQLLDDIRRNLLKVFKPFYSFINWDEQARRDWVGFIQAPISWGIDGGMGASGGETVTASFMDAFLGVPGECLMYTSKHKRRKNMAESVVRVLNVLESDCVELRFSSHLGVSKEQDPLWQKRGEIVSSLHIWRLAHARVTSKVLVGAEYLASGLEKAMEGGEGVGITTGKELYIRAKETLKAKVPYPLGDFTGNG